MKRIHSRINKIEDAIKPERPHFLVAHGREEAEKNILQYQKDHLGLPVPTVLIVETIAKSPDSGTGR